MIDLIKLIVKKNPGITSSELVDTIKYATLNDSITIKDIAKELNKLRSFCDIKIDGWKYVNGKDEPLSQIKNGNTHWFSVKEIEVNGNI
jgi:hypothetical protein